MNESSGNTTSNAAAVFLEQVISPRDLNNDGASNPFNGTLDDVVIAQRWFRPEEIKAVYNKGFNGKEVTTTEIPVGAGNFFTLL